MPAKTPATDTTRLFQPGKKRVYPTREAPKALPLGKPCRFRGCTIPGRILRPGLRLGAYIVEWANGATTECDADKLIVEGV